MNRHDGLEPNSLSPEQLFERLAAAPLGLTSAEAAERLRHDGANVLPDTRQVPLVLRFGKHLVHRFALLLWAGAVLSLAGEHFSPGEGMVIIAVALIAVVFINAGFMFWQEMRVEQAMAAFRRMLSPRARVLRDGQEVDIPADRVVVGDVIMVREGDRIPADARLFEANALKVDHSPLTGECEPQLRTVATVSGPRIDSRNLVFSGTLVTTGTGRALVYATGSATEVGRVARATQETALVETPIRRELRHFISVISTIAISLGVVFFAAGWIMGNPFWTNLVFAIGIIVANVPEGLLPTVTLALALASRRMARHNALLKTLESAETLGSTTVICTDKTGTLTQNQMRVTELITDLLGERAGEREREGRDSGTDGIHEVALRVMVLCNNAAVTGAGAAARATGDPTETALLIHAEKVSAGAVEGLRRRHPRVFERPFDSVTREMATVHALAGDAGLEAVLKGAPEAVAEQCVSVWRDGALVPVDAQAKERILARANELARKGRRVLALARKRLDSAEDLDREVLAGGYEWVGLVAMRDPPRPEVESAVARCRAAGIRVVVISGDHPLTVEAVAREVGIVTGEAAVYTGADLARWSKAALRRVLARDQSLFARTSPLDKLLIVTALQEMDHVVAVTGDGVNDAPALKRANIGVAMGLGGTDVAREAADMVLMDDNFATIVTAVEEGRVIYSNIRRFIGYVLTSNVPEILPYIAFVLLGIPLPLPVLLILAIDLGTDMAPAIGLAAESAEDDVMHMPPRRHTDRLLSPRLLLSSYLVWGLFESAAGFAAYAWVLWTGGWRPSLGVAPGDALYGQAIAAFFAAVIMCQVANLMVWRTTSQSVFAKGLFANRAILLGIAIELFLLFVIVATDAGHAVFATRTLSPLAWLIPVPFGLVMLLAAEMTKRRARTHALDQRSS